MGGRKPSVSRFSAREGGGAGESPPLHRNTRGRVDGWQEALRLTFRHDGGFVVVLEGCGGWEGTLGRGGDRNSTRWRVKSLAGLAVGCQ